MTALSTVIREFSAATDARGVHSRIYYPGEQHDFGPSTQDLRKAGFIRSALAPATKEARTLDPCDFDEEYRRYFNKMGDLSRKDRADCEEDAVLVCEIRAAEDTDKQDRSTDLAAVLAGEPLPDESTVERAKDRRRQIHRERTALAEARSSLYSPMRAAHRRASIKVCDAVRPEHDELGRQLALSVAALFQVDSAYRRFRDDLQRNNVGFVLHDASLDQVIGPLAGRHSKVAEWFRGMVKAGLISKADVPEVLR